MRQVIDQSYVPAKIDIDKSGANIVAVEAYQAESAVDMELRRAKYLNNIVAQGHCAVKRMTRPMLRFKSFCLAAILLAEVEIMRMIRRG